MPDKVQIAKYVIGIAGSPVPQSTYPAWINLLDINNRWSVVRFHHSQTELPPSGPEGQLFVINMPLAVLDSVVDMLRNEKPVYVVRGENGRIWLSTEQEDVGSSE